MPVRVCLCARVWTAAPVHMYSHISACYVLISVRMCWFLCAAVSVDVILTVRIHMRIIAFHPTPPTHKQRLISLDYLHTSLGTLVWLIICINICSLHSNATEGHTQLEVNLDSKLSDQWENVPLCVRVCDVTETICIFVTKTGLRILKDKCAFIPTKKNLQGQLCMYQFIASSHLPHVSALYFLFAGFLHIQYNSTRMLQG